MWSRWREKQVTAQLLHLQWCTAKVKASQHMQWQQMPVFSTGCCKECTESQRWVQMEWNADDPSAIAPDKSKACPLWLQHVARQQLKTSTCAAAVTRHSLSQMKPAGLAQSKNQMPGELSAAAAAPGGSVCCSTRPHTRVSLSGTYCSKEEAANKRQYTRQHQHQHQPRLKRVHIADMQNGS
jgi:hypothetical protein